MLILIGASGSGKSKLAKELAQYGCKQIITYTTRPIRIADGEQNHVNYHFISNDDFLEKINQGFYLEYDHFEVANGDTWYYGTAKEDVLKANRNDILVLTPSGLRALKKINGLIVDSFYIDVSEKNRLIRLANRGDSTLEILRRILTDDGLFRGMSEETEYVIDNNQSFDEAANQIKDILIMKGIIK